MLNFWYQKIVTIFWYQKFNFWCQKLISDIKKKQFLISGIQFLISENRDIRKSFSDIRNWFSNIRIWFSDIRKSRWFCQGVGSISYSLRHRPQTRCPKKIISDIRKWFLISENQHSSPLWRSIPRPFLGLQHGESAILCCTGLVIRSTACNLTLLLSLFP